MESWVSNTKAILNRATALHTDEEGYVWGKIGTMWYKTSRKKKPSNNESEFIDNLTDFLGNTEGQTTEEIRQELIDEGIDIDKMTDDVEKMIADKIKNIQSHSGPEEEDGPWAEGWPERSGGTIRDVVDGAHGVCAKTTDSPCMPDIDDECKACCDEVVMMTCDTCKGDGLTVFEGCSEACLDCRAEGRVPKTVRDILKED